jgi:lipopolysaccharide/colanic/teichoic acid biosynthesis glycosyltransferase
MSSFQEIAKRGFDIVVATAGLLLLSPLMFLISLGIKSTSPGPLNNTAFDVFEFRTTVAFQDEKTFPNIPDEIWYATPFGHSCAALG